jgi:hypothetical protein
MSEAELFTEIAAILKRLGWRYHHIPATAYRKNHIRSGFPDLVAVKGRCLIFAELKGERALRSDKQLDWGNALWAVSTACPSNVRYLVWRPSNLLSGEIDRALL